MTDLVTRLRAEVYEDVNERLDRLLDEAADRIADLELALVELSHTDGSSSNVASANTLAMGVRTAARRQSFSLTLYVSTPENPWPWAAPGTKQLKK